MNATKSVESVHEPPMTPDAVAALKRIGGRVRIVTATDYVARGSGSAAASGASAV